MIFIQLLVTALAVFIGYRLYEFWRLGRALAFVPGSFKNKHLIVAKKELFRKTACLFGTLLLFIVAADTTVFMRDGHARPDLFNAHVVSGVLMLILFIMMRVRSGDEHPRSHRVFGYVTFALFAYVLGTGLWFLWKL